MRKVATIGAITGALFAAAPAIGREAWRPIHQHHAHVADCRVFAYKPAALIVANGPSDGEWFAIAAITCTHSAWPQIGLKVCEQQRNLASWRTIHCRRAQQPDIGTPNYLTTDGGPFFAQPFHWYREKLRVHVRHTVRVFYGPEASL